MVQIMNSSSKAVILSEGEGSLLSLTSNGVDARHSARVAEVSVRTRGLESNYPRDPSPSLRMTTLLTGGSLAARRRVRHSFWATAEGSLLSFMSDCANDRHSSRAAEVSLRARGLESNYPRDPSPSLRMTSPLMGGSLAAKAKDLCYLSRLTA